MSTLVYTSPVKIDKIHADLQDGLKSGKFNSIAYRKYQLLQLCYLVRDNAQRFSDAMTSDLGRPLQENYFLEINVTIRDINNAYTNVEKWAKPEKPGFSMIWSPMRRVIYKVPKGVVLIMGPFNYPLWETIPPLAGAIAAGCPAVVKPSEKSPAVAALLAELVPQYLDQDLVQVVNGAVPECTNLLSLRWDHIFFTGSGRVGKIVAEAAAKFVTPVTLELGGKSPVFVDPNCDLEMAARRILWGKAVNAGQTCVAPDYVLVPRSFQDKFIQALKTADESFYPPSKDSSSPGASSKLVTHEAFMRVKGLLDNTMGTIVIGGETDEATKFIAPTVVRDVHGGDVLMSEEIFGPVLPIVPVEDVDEAIAFVNARDHPLALYVFSQDPGYKEKVFGNTKSGGALANEVVIHPGGEGLPFGGIGPSGYGEHTGKYTFDTFTHLRSSIDSPSWMDKFIGYRFPPYTDAKFKASQRLFPRIPPRPQGPPSATAVRPKSVKKWFFLVLLVAVIARLRKRLTIFLW